jgi:predicted nicotinamide N-methyase
VASVTGADIDALAIAAIRLNGAANGVTIGVSQADPVGTSLANIDVLLVGDLFYELDLGRRVLEWIEDGVRDGRHVLVGDPRRSYFPAARFVEVASYNVPVTRELEDADIKRTAVWRPAGPILTHARSGNDSNCS